MRRKAIQPSNPSEVANPKKSKTRRRVLKTVRNLLKILSKRADNVQKPRGRGRPPKIKSEHPIINPEDEGVTFKQIETWFKRKWPDQKGEADIQTAVLEEVAEGRLVILPNKKYILKNWRVTVKDITIKLPENDLAEELVLAGAAAKDQVEDLNKMAVSSSHLSNSCIPFRTDEDNSAPDLVIEEEEQANHKRKSPITAQHTSLVKKFKLENGEDIRLIRMEGSEVKNVCGTCDLTEDCNSSGEAEPLLTCKDCNISFHPSCLSYPKELAERASKYPWECASCKTCLVCGDAEEEQMLICDSCDRGYHMQCHDPPVSDKISSDEWLCSSCLNDSEESNKEEQDDKEHSSNNAEEDASRDVNNSAGPKSQASTSDKQGSESVGSQLLPTPNSSPSRTAEAEEDLKNISTIDFPLLPKLILSVPGDPPNATNWTVEDVHGYFTKAGFSLQAETFKNEEIDGKALLLLTRPDVLSGMKFKLGPALKIYAHIQRIQESSFPE